MSPPLRTPFSCAGSTNNFIELEQITQQSSNAGRHPPQVISHTLEAQSSHSKELKKKVIFLEKPDSAPTSFWTRLFTNLHILSISLRVSPPFYPVLSLADREEVQGFEGVVGYSQLLYQGSALGICPLPQSSKQPPPTWGSGGCCKGRGDENRWVGQLPTGTGAAPPHPGLCALSWGRGEGSVSILINSLQTLRSSRVGTSGR